MGDLASLPTEVLATIPLETPPAGRVPNFDDPGANGSGAVPVIVVGAVGAAFTVFVVALRLYTSAFMKKTIRFDDWAAVVATVLALADYGVMVYSLRNGTVGYHSWTVSLLTFTENFGRPIVTWTCLYYAALLASKVALCALFFRIFSPKPVLRYLIYVGLVLATIASCIGIFGFIGVCKETGLDLLSCDNKPWIIDITASCINNVNDIFLFVLPLFGINTLQMRKRQKLQTSFVFGMGFSAVISSLIGTAYRFVDMYTDDMLWHFTPMMILVMFELNTTIVVSCLPGTVPLLREHAFPSARAALESLRARRKGKTGQIGSVEYASSQESGSQMYRSGEKRSISKFRADSTHYSSQSTASA